MTQLSQHFSLEELTHTDTGLPNHPSDTELDHLRSAAFRMEAVRTLLGGAAIHVDSGYRSMAVNLKVRGVPTSAHCLGYAIDFKCPDFGTPVEIVRAISESNIKFDQCIEEGTWVHISFDPRLRQQVKTAHFADGKPTKYTTGVA